MRACACACACVCVCVSTWPRAPRRPGRTPAWSPWRRRSCSRPGSPGEPPGSAPCPSGPRTRGSLSPHPPDNTSTCTHTHAHTHTHKERHARTHADKHTHRHTDRHSETDRQIDGDRHRHTQDEEEVEEKVTKVHGDLDFSVVFETVARLWSVP